MLRCPFIGVAVMVGKLATGQLTETRRDAPQKSEAAVALGKLGGQARAQV